LSGVIFTVAVRVMSLMCEEAMQRQCSWLGLLLLSLSLSH